MKTLITGITGFVGFHLAQHLLRAGHSVLGVSRSAIWHHPVATQTRNRVELLAWDLQQEVPDHVRLRLMAFQPDCVYHLAGLSIPARCGQTSPTDEALRVNVAGTRAVLELVASMPWLPRVVVASSNHVYAPVAAAAPRVNEQAPIAPPTAYGVTKLLAEHEVQRAIARHGVQAMIVRGFQHTGPYQPAGLMLSDWIAQLAGSPVHSLVVKCLDSYLDLVDVRDAAVGYQFVATAGIPGDRYNLGSGQARRSGDVLELLLSVAGKHPPIQELSPGERWNPIACTDKLHALGWQPRIPLPETLRDMYRCWFEKDRTD